MSFPLGPNWLLGGAVLLAGAVLLGWIPRSLMDADGPVRTRRSAELALAAAVTALATLVLTKDAVSPVAALALAAAAGTLAACVLFDARWMLIPDLYWAVVAGAALFRPMGLSWLEAGLGLIMGFGLLQAVRHGFRRRRGVEGLGFGDVKLTGALGVLLGPIAVLWLIVIASVGGLLYAGLTRRRADAPMPFGSLAGVTAVGMIWVQQLP